MNAEGGVRIKKNTQLSTLSSHSGVQTQQELQLANEGHAATLRLPSSIQVLGCLMWLVTRWSGQAPSEAGNHSALTARTPAEERLDGVLGWP